MTQAGAEQAAGEDAVRRGRTLGVDVGRARVGLATADPDGLIATPVATLARDARRGRDVGELVAHALELDVVAVYVGLPVNLRGEHTPSTQDALDYARSVARALADAGHERPGRGVRDAGDLGRVVRREQAIEELSGSPDGLVEPSRVVSHPVKGTPGPPCRPGLR